jgi:hypothetical protein
MADLVTEISPLHIITASETVGNANAALPKGTFDTNLTARIQYSDAQQASGSGVWTFTVQLSYNQGATWVTVATGTAITLTATAQDGEQALSFSPTSPAASGQTLVQVLATLTGTPVTPTMAYRADLIAGASG